MSDLGGFKKVCVIGAGQMGNGIAQVMATSGLQVTLYDVAATQVENAKKNIETSLNKLQAKEILSAAQVQTALANLTYQSTPQFADADLVIEAVIENESIKEKVFRHADEHVQKNAVLASNTSSIPITRLASYTKRPDKFIGLHFMNPVPLMKLVEIIPGMATSDETKNRTTQLITGIGKEISLSQDFPGFVVNRILMPMINEAFFALMEGVASAEDIDKGMKLGTNQPMGPLTLADFIGLDTCLAILKVLHNGLGDPKYRPCPLLSKYVEAGYLGRKTKRGVYQY